MIGVVFMMVVVVGAVEGVSFERQSRTATKNIICK
jgi:hypothetical protein